MQSSSNASVVLRAIGCHRCDAEAGVRLGKEFLCGSCAIEDLRVDLEPPVVLCDACQRESTLRLDERFLCGRCALALLCMDRQDDPELLQGFGSALASAVVGQREAAIAWAWEMAKRTRDGKMTVSEASAMHHRAIGNLAQVAEAADGRTGTVRLVEAASSVFGTYAASVDGHLETLADDVTGLRGHVQELERTVDELQRERDDIVHRLRRAEMERGALIRHITAAKEEERNRIAGEIHDDTVQTLVALQMRLQILGGRAGDATPKALDELSRVTAASIGRLRTLMFELRSDLLDRYGLAGMLRELLGRTQDQFGLDFRLVDRLEAETPSDVGINVYRIAQEAITNVRKHAEAAFVEVDLEGHDDGVLLTVCDDGTGFDVRAEPPADHAGLRFMRDRAERAGGWIQMTSTLGTGTTVRAWIPKQIGGTP
ncbi:MAG: sensor histidine kinase [Actinomycetota bacterium]